MSIKERKLQVKIAQLQAKDLIHKKLVQHLQQELGVEADGIYGPDTHAALRAKIERLERHIVDLRELREFDRIKLERLKGMGV